LALLSRYALEERMLLSELINTSAPEGAKLRIALIGNSRSPRHARVLKDASSLADSGVRETLENSSVGVGELIARARDSDHACRIAPVM
jgi:hypothetical protein